MLKNTLVTSLEIWSPKSNMKSGEVASRIKVHRPEYENFKPLMLPKITEINGYIQPSPSETNKADESCLYETLPVGGLHQMSNGGQKSADKVDMQNDMQRINRRHDMKVASPTQPHLYNKCLVAEVKERIEKGLNIKRTPETSTKSLTKPLHPKQHVDVDALLPASYGLQNEHGIPSKTVAGAPALVKQRLSIFRQPDIDRNNTDTDSVSNVYENTMKGGEVVMPTANNTSPQIFASKGNDKPQCRAMQRKEITHFHSSGGNREIVHDVDDNSLVYENITLQMPTNVEKGMTKSHTFPTMTTGNDDHDLRDPMFPSPLSPLGTDGTNFSFSTNKQNKTKHTVTQKADKIQLVLPATKKPPVSAKPSIVSLQTKLLTQDDYKKTHKAKEDLPCDAVKEPEVDKDSTVSTVLLDSGVKVPSEKNAKANSRSSTIQSIQFMSSVSCGIQLQNEPSQLQQQEHVFKAKEINVKQLKVNELGVWMTEKLRLGKYVSHFAEELIDGALLVDLEEDMLITSFGFSVLEAKRLRKFATEGHVPT